MKTTVIKILSALAVVSAFLMLAVNTVAAGYAFTVMGVLAMLFADYGRKIEPLRVPDRVIPFSEPAGSQPALRTAA